MMRTLGDVEVFTQLMNELHTERHDGRARGIA